MKNINYKKSVKQKTKDLYYFATGNTTKNNYKMGKFVKL